MAQKRPASPMYTDQKIRKLANIINSSLFTDNIKDKLSEAFREENEYKSDRGLQVYNEPFPCCVVEDFISDTDFVHKLKDELSQLKFFEKSNDLFKFQQSNDLMDEKSKYTAVLRDLLYNALREWMEDVMQVSLETTVDMSCAKYEYTDVLLCHDDELEGRRIAFIYYLVPEDWNETDGGSLDLFSVDGGGHPDRVVCSITPSFNSFVFFEVSEKSFHQVSEILSADKTRMSISGWFHGESLSRKTPDPLPLIMPEPHSQMEDDILLSWINPIYLNPEIVGDIEEQFEDNSEIQLKDFLLKSKYESLVEELTSCDIPWIKGGPPNQRLCWFLPTDVSCETIHQFLELIHSIPFFKLLKMFTGLDMANLTQEVDDSEEETEEFDVPPSCVAEVRKWEHGCYTLLHDQDHCGGDFVLDALLHVQCDGWDESTDAGYISYIANDGGEELMRIQPVSNCLSLVYRDEETTRFVKYFNHKLSENSCKTFYDISAVYFEGTRD